MSAPNAGTAQVDTMHRATTSKPQATAHVRTKLVLKALLGLHVGARHDAGVVQQHVDLTPRVLQRLGGVAAGGGGARGGASQVGAVSSCVWQRGPGWRVRVGITPMAVFESGNAKRRRAPDAVEVCQVEPQCVHVSRGHRRPGGEGRVSVGSGEECVRRAVRAAGRGRLWCRKAGGKQWMLCSRLPPQACRRAGRGLPCSGGALT